MSFPAPKWLDTEVYPFTSRYFMVNSHKMHFIDTGGEGDILLFVHGTPSWSFDFRKVIKALSDKYRCIAIDHIGFGLSDKPEVYDYSTQNHALSLQKFIDHFGLRQITMVLHDFGGPIGMSYAVSHPENIRSLVILNSWLWNCEDSQSFKKMKKILANPLLPVLYKYCNLSVRFLLPISFGSKKLPVRIKRYYVKPFKKLSSRAGTIAFAKSLLKDQDWFESLWNKARHIAGTRVLFVWGMNDKFITPGFLVRFKWRFFNNKTVTLNGCGHFPQEEESEAVSGAIRDFMLG